MQSIIEPQTKPATEWISGRAVQKVSPTGRHASAQTRIAAALLAWADAFAIGRIGTEWEFRIAPPGEVSRSLVPDVAYLSYQRLGFEEDLQAQLPTVAPNVAIEVLSPNDRRRDVDEKIRVYLSSGTDLVAIADPEKRTVTLHDSKGTRMFSSGEIVTHPALSNFELAVSDIFAKPGDR